MCASGNGEAGEVWSSYAMSENIEGGRLLGEEVKHEVGYLECCGRLPFHYR